MGKISSNTSELMPGNKTKFTAVCRCSIWKNYMEAIRTSSKESFIGICADCREIDFLNEIKLENGTVKNVCRGCLKEGYRPCTVFRRPSKWGGSCDECGLVRTHWCVNTSGGRRFLCPECFKVFMNGGDVV
jgi:hypothetical protein